MSDDYELIPRYPTGRSTIAVPKPAVGSITGATTQQQLDSLIAALVARGAVTDDR